MLARLTLMKYVYILQSLSGEHFYTGITDDLVARLSKPNSGAVTHTSKFRPWQIKTYVAFSDESRAIAFREVSEVRIETSVRENTIVVLTHSLSTSANIPRLAKRGNHPL